MKILVDVKVTRNFLSPKFNKNYESIKKLLIFNVKQTEIYYTFPEVELQLTNFVFLIFQDDRKSNS